MPAVTGTPTTFGGIGRVEWAPTNAPDDPFPTWVDITPYVRSENTPMDATRVRQTELDTVQPSVFQVILDNTDLRFTFGLLSGPYGANWAPAKQIRWTETIGSRTFQIFKGYLEALDITNWADIGYQEISLSCTDRLTRLSRARPFVSTAGAHIMGSARNNALQGYWSLTDPALRFVDSTGRQPILANTLVAAQPGVIKPQGGPSLPGDDVATASTTDTDAYLQATLPTGITLSGTNALTLVGWVNRTSTTVLSQTLLMSIENQAGEQLTIQESTPTPGWTVFAEPGLTGLGTVSIVEASTSRWSIVGAQMTLSPPSVSLWVDDQVQTVVIGSSPPASMTVNLMICFASVVGAMAHLQLYLGNPSDFTHVDFLAQRQVGLTGLAYQTTGQRINSILDYAGVPTADRAVDPGCSYMQRAQLAGQDPGAAILDAVSTERGRGFAGGDGRYVFHDRTRIYNV